jgi:hypothetical protein
MRSTGSCVMKRFSEMDIAPLHTFIGDSIKIDKVIGKEIVIDTYRIVESKYNKNESGKCLHLQIEFDNEKRVLFTGSDRLMNQINQVVKEDFPFIAKIERRGRGFEFE